MLGNQRQEAEGRDLLPDGSPQVSDPLTTAALPCLPLKVLDGLRKCRRSYWVLHISSECPQSEEKMAVNFSLVSNFGEAKKQTARPLTNRNDVGMSVTYTLKLPWLHQRKSLLTCCQSAVLQTDVLKYGTNFAASSLSFWIWNSQISSLKNHLWCCKTLMFPFLKSIITWG